MNTKTHDTTPATLSAAEAAKMLNISESHFHDMRREGLLGPEPVRLGRSVRWRRAELDAWLNAGCPNRQTWQVSRGDA
jgi:excisionase family DNA binding protein